MRLSKIDLIEQKVFGKLSNSQEKEFVYLMTTDSNFAVEYGLMSDLTSYIANEKLYSFRDKLDVFYKEHKSVKANNIISLSKLWYYAASVAAIGLIFLGSYFLMDKQMSSTQLFDKYYQLDDVYLNTREGNSPNTDVLEQGLTLFERDRYKESINYFEQLPNSVTAIYYSGVAHMELGEYKIATYKFEQVINNYLNVFYDQANWYKGLCLVKQEKYRDARSILQEISKTDSYYNIQAKELLQELK